MKIKRLYILEDSHKSFETLQEAEYYVYTQECAMSGLAPIGLVTWLLNNYRMTPIGEESS